MRFFSGPIVLVVLLAAINLAGCVENPATGGTRFTLLTDQKEREIGEATATDALKSFGQYKPESRISRYVDSLCTRIWSQTAEAQQPLQCLVLNSEQYNAWATPGYLNVYRGLLPYINSEAELAAVIGHEAGHINAHHVSQRISQDMLASLLVTGAAVAVAARTNDANLANGLYVVGGLSAKAAVQSYGRGHELQADELGQQALQRAGYPPQAAVSMLTGMQLNEAYETQLSQMMNDGKPVPPESMLGRLFASHPATPERLQKAQENAARLTLSTIPPSSDEALGRTRYLQALDGTTFGPQTHFGVLTRGALILPAQRLKLALPDGFAFTYIPNASSPTAFGTWQGAHAPSYVKASVSVHPYQRGLNPASFLESYYARGRLIGLANVALSDGTRAATALVTPGLIGNKPLRAMAVGDPDADAMVLLTYTYPTQAEQQDEDATLQNIFLSSRRLSADEAKAVQPVKIRIFRASAGDTVTSRAKHLPMGALQIPLFRALNGLPEPEENLTPGFFYKTLSAPVI